jgi:tripartite-type tricarboxylate transporter receptor subunit TctC
MNDVIGGNIPFTVVPIGDVIELHKAGSVKVLATSGEQRFAGLPDVPTFKESGFAIDGSGWYALYGPAKLPPAQIAEISAAVQKALAMPEVQQRALALGLSPRSSTPEELQRFQRADTEQWGPAVRASGFKAQ